MKATILALLGLLLLAAPAAVQAQFTYTKNADGTTITITGYTGPGGAVIIPSTTNGLAVTGIGNGAFLGLTSLTSVTIPGSVTSIGWSAFEYCTSLTNAMIASGLTSIGNQAFYGCTSLGSVTIPGSVTNIGGSAFFSCRSLTSVTIPGSVTSIGASAFASCGRLTSAYFKGDAPTADSTVFLSDNKATAYYLPGTTGWSSIFAGRSAVLWNPLIQASDASFGVRNNQFGFNITGTAKIPIVVEACTDLTSSVWTPLQTLTLTNGLFYFSEPMQTNSSGRYYRISSP